MTHLVLDQNQIRNISPIEDVTNLKHLAIKENPIQDKKPLQRLLKQFPNLELDIELPSADN